MGRAAPRPPRPRPCAAAGWPAPGGDNLAARGCWSPAAWSWRRPRLSLTGRSPKDAAGPVVQTARCWPPWASTCRRSMPACRQPSATTTGRRPSGCGARPTSSSPTPTSAPTLAAAVRRALQLATHEATARDEEVGPEPPGEGCAGSSALVFSTGSHTSPRGRSGGGCAVPVPPVCCSCRWWTSAAGPAWTVQHRPARRALQGDLDVVESVGGTEEGGQLGCGCGQGAVAGGSWASTSVTIPCGGPGPVADHEPVTTVGAQAGDPAAAGLLVRSRHPGHRAVSQRGDLAVTATWCSGGQGGDGGDLGRVQLLPEDPLGPLAAPAGDGLLAGDDQVQAEVVAGLGQRLLQ
jgi:hypothetical protein